MTSMVMVVGVTPTSVAVSGALHDPGLDVLVVAAAAAAVGEDAAVVGLELREQAAPSRSTAASPATNRVRVTTTPPGSAGPTAPGPASTLRRGAGGRLDARLARRRHGVGAGLAGKAVG